MAVSLTYILSYLLLRYVTRLFFNFLFRLNITLLYLLHLLQHQNYFHSESYSSLLTVTASSRAEYILPSASLLSEELYL